MHKETLVAVIIGLTLGLILTFGIYQWQQTSRKSSEIIIPSTQTPQEKIEAPSNQTLIIKNPSDGTITDKADIVLEGSGPADAFLAIFVGNKETILKIGADQTFATKLDLQKGPNYISIIATENSGNSYKSEILVVYEPKVE